MADRDLVERAKRIYDDAAGSGPDRFARVLCTDWHRQYYRFAEIVRLLDALDHRATSVLDVGCGNGEFLNFLNFCGFSGRYVGIDINARLIEEARANFPFASFAVVDLMTEDVERCDFVVMSGVFNYDYGQDGAWIHRFVDRMAAAAKRRVVFNAITTYVNFREPGMFYVELAPLIDHVARTISRKFELRHHFVPYNFTLCIHKDEAWSSIAEAKGAR